MNRLWDQWHLAGGPSYPHEKVIQFCFRNFPPDRRASTTALDLGCGSGANIVFLARSGFITHGTDISPVGIENTRQRLAAEGLQAKLRAESAEAISFQGVCFGLVICVGVLECLGQESAEKVVKRVAEVMRPGARGLFLFCGEGDFRLQEDNPHALHGYTETEVRGLFAEGFQEAHFDHYITTYMSQAKRQFDWLVTVKK